MLCHELTVLNASVTPPFPLDDENLSETTRLTHRVLDLRRPEMQHNMRLRYRVAMEVRRFLDDMGFIDIETPMLTKSTPEGARDYLVPSRVHDGHFFALPQSPAAVQAAADGGRLRPLLPDHQVLPRRGPARRPPARVHADRHRDQLPRRAGDPRHHRGHGAARLQAGAGRRAARVPGDDLCRGDAPVRLGQARPARQAGLHRADRRDDGRRLQGLLRAGDEPGRTGGCAVRARRRRDEPRRDRRAHRVREDLRRQGPGLDQGQRPGQGPRRAAEPHRQEPARCAPSPRSWSAPAPRPAT